MNVNPSADPDDLLADLDDLLPDETTTKPTTKSAPSPSASPVLKSETCQPFNDSPRLCVQTSHKQIPEYSVCVCVSFQPRQQKRKAASHLMMKTTSWMLWDLTAIKTNPRKKRPRFCSTGKGHFCFWALRMLLKTKTNVDNLGFSLNGVSFSSRCVLRSEPPQRPRTKLDEILRSSTSQRPPTGERKNQESASPPRGDKSPLHLKTDTKFFP